MDARTSSPARCLPPLEALKGDHYSPIARNALLFLPDASERQALLEREAFFVPAYVGPSGWLGLSFHVVGRVDRVDWDEVAELVDASYRLTAPAGLVEELDARAWSAGARTTARPRRVGSRRGRVIGVVCR